MRSLLTRIIICMAFTALILPFAGKKDVLAQGESINYVFTGLAIPEGQPEVFSVDAGTIDVLRQNPALINTFVSALAERYDTGVAVIDQGIEAAYLAGVINGTALPGNHVPVYRAAFTAEKMPATGNDQGSGDAPVIVLPVMANMDINNGNYVDINITTQTLTLFQNGMGTAATPIVTGNVRAHHNTPEGLFAVQYKQRNRTLRGEDYEAFVHYWMRIVNNVGIHDASWRGSFGGEIYKTNGSHGCINVPPSFMPSLYEVCPEGTPVWVHS